MSAVPAKLGRYEIVKHLANGGMAQVLIARATGIEGFERHVVVKRIHSEHAGDPDFVKMFLDEARTAAALHHNNIVQVHDIGKENGEYFFAMEYVHGQDLRILLRECSRRREKVPWEHVVTIMTSAASGLHHAHELRGADRKLLGLVHRDVSPANVLVGYDGTVKVVDFGIAKAALRTGEGTRAGALKGKVSYMAPEQCAGKPIDRRSDVYALGVVLYELSTVRRLFKGENDFLTMSAIVAGDIPHPTKARPDMPPALADIILKALSSKPADRYQTADEMREALEQFAADQRLRTSNGALASYMKRVFGAQPEPWLVEEELVLELTVDFDGSDSGLAQPSHDASEHLAIPSQIDPAVSAPIMKARRRITESPPIVAAEGSQKTKAAGTGTSAKGTGGGVPVAARPPASTPNSGTTRPTVVIPPRTMTPTGVAKPVSPPAVIPVRADSKPPVRMTPPAGVAVRADSKPPERRTPPPFPASRTPTESEKLAKLTDAKPVEAKSVDAKAAETKDAKSVDAKPITNPGVKVDAKPERDDDTKGDAKPDDSKPADAKPSQTATAPPVKPRLSSDVARLPQMDDDDFTDEKSSSASRPGTAEVVAKPVAEAKPARTAVEENDEVDVAKPDPKRRIAIVAGVVVIAIGIVVFLVMRGGNESKPPTPPPPVTDRGSAPPPEPPKPAVVIDAAPEVVTDPGSGSAGSAVMPGSGSAPGSAGSAVAGSAVGSGSDAGSGSAAVKKRPRKKWNPDELFIK